MLGPKSSRPVRRPSDVGLPSPQVLTKNSSLVCSTPTVGGGRLRPGTVLPSPINRKL